MRLGLGGSLAGVSALAALAACASLYGATDVPTPAEAGGDASLESAAPAGDAADAGRPTPDAPPPVSDSAPPVDGAEPPMSDGATTDATADTSPPTDASPACVIGGQPVASGTANPSNACQSCQPAVSSSQWSPLPNGHSCAGMAGGSCAAGACVMPASCAPGGAGMTNCGPGGSGTESCCTSLEVPGGTYDRAYTNSGEGPLDGGAPATISGLRVDKYEVTVGRFRQFVNAWAASASSVTPAVGAGKHVHLNEGQGLANVTAPASFEPGWAMASNPNIDPTAANLMTGAPFSTWTASPGANENQPINTVTWAEAYAFCIWDGGFLPSEAEWEYTAAGGAMEEEYPWGNVAPGTANAYAIYDCYYPPSASGACGGPNSSQAPVGTTIHGAGLYGQFDLAGNTEEWTLDFYAPYVSPSNDAANFTLASTRVMRGGYYNSDATELVPPYRDNQSSTERSWSVGIRCARSP